MSIRFAGVALIAFGLGCTSVPIHNVASAVPPGMTAEQVREAIVTAAARRRWVVQEQSPSSMLATIDVRGKHSATVDITYDTTGYAIAYRDSSNLDYEDGEIHKNYNGWVIKLDKAIRKELFREVGAGARR
jgi:hypothetical protein